MCWKNKSSFLFIFSIFPANILLLNSLVIGAEKDLSATQSNYLGIAVLYLLLKI